MAVGYNGHGNFQGTFVETMNKNSWTVTPSPMTASPYIDDSLNTVSCTSPTSCAAAGRATDVTGTRERTLVLSLKGGTWRLSPSPNTTAALNSLAGISCASSTTCVAVGYDGTPSSQRTLVEFLSNGTWRVMPSPEAGPPYVVNFLNAVSCMSPTHCVAAGFAADPTGMESRTLIETLSGGNLENNAQPGHVVANNELYGVQCTTPTSCIAVGDDGSISAQRPGGNAFRRHMEADSKPGHGTGIERTFLCLVPLADVVRRGRLCHEPAGHRGSHSDRNPERRRVEDHPEPQHGVAVE